MQEPIFVDEKLVRLADTAGRKSAVKEAPASLDLVSSEEDIAKFTLEGLKKLARSCGVELPKYANKAAAAGLIIDAYRSQRRRAGDAETVSLR